MSQRLSKLIRILQDTEIVLPTVKKYRFSTSNLILAFLREAPGAQLLAHQILDRLKLVDSEWVTLFEDSNDIRMLADKLKRKHNARMCLVKWAQDWFEGFLLASVYRGFYVAPMLIVMLYMVRSESHRNPESSFLSPNENREALKAQLWLRDGCRTPFTGYIDPQAPREEVLKAPGLPNDYIMIADIGHVLPFWMSSRPVVYSYLQTFGNVSLSFDEIQEHLTKPCNSAIFDVSWRSLFSRFSVSIQYDPAVDDYILRLFEPRVPLVVLTHKDQPLIGLHAGTFTDFDDKLSAEFCNIHHAIGKILHTSGAAKVINEIVDTEETAKELGLLCLCGEHDEDSDSDEYEFSRSRYRHAAINLLDRKLAEVAAERAMCVSPDVGWKQNRPV